MLVAVQDPSGRLISLRSLVLGTLDVDVPGNPPAMENAAFCMKASPWLHPTLLNFSKLDQLAFVFLFFAFFWGGAGALVQP